MSELRKAAGAVAKTSAAIANSADGLMAAAVGDLPSGGGSAPARRQNDRRRYNDADLAEAERRELQEERDVQMGRRDAEQERGW